MARLLVALLLLLVPLAGCLGDSGDEGSDHDDHDDHDDGHMDETMDGNATEAIHQPVTLDVTLDADTAQGSTPLNVTFTATIQRNETTLIPGDEAAGIPDEHLTELSPYDGNFTWTFGPGDGNTTTGTQDDFNGTFQVSYVAGGNHTATLTIVPDQGNATTAEQTIQVFAGPPLPATQVIEGGASILLPGQNVDSCDMGVNTVTHELLIDGEGTAQAFTVTGFDVAFSYSATGLDLDIDLLDPTGAVIGSSHNFDLISGADSISVEGSWPAGTYTFVVVMCTGVAVDYEFTATASLSPA